MAFVKDPLNATNPREIIEYSQDLEDRIEVGFDDVADYIVEQGSNYRKWESGMLEQWDTVEGITGGTGLISKPYPKQEFISTPLTFSVSAYSGGGVQLARFITENPLMNSYRAYVLLENRVASNEPVKVNYYAIGRWK